jgi:hypothetical protein
LPVDELVEHRSNEKSTIINHLTGGPPALRFGCV